VRMQYSLDWIQNKLFVLEIGILGPTKKHFSPENTAWWETFFEKK
jgi:hypothetical protein